VGDNYLEAQAKNTRKRRAKAAAAIKAPRLLVRPDQVLDHFTVECRDGYELLAEDLLYCYPGAGSNVIDVVRGHERVGTVGQLGGSESLAAEIEGAGVGRLRVISFDKLGGSAQVQRITEDESGGDQR
jgi:hypothetical protein